ncbi:ArnT family glycosyltransferase [Streptacidiphilus jiangxiensis]|uniref:Dolichyl-phosphate-mannose-protein mannosyltransferase n=1 Tax=Streptacidiphilus jiangxiensis TaxID=235985 RepID=A0A1H7SRG2_STRJI|nr:glycosyltransferase family 39 protein [Streptacidiphilus jiangxiensis]SEL75210.1 Dolichyl-phosphate-mannose-protein mannosyltransferase [Streptacidiphilus jiangxiensis]
MTSVVEAVVTHPPAEQPAAAPPRGRLTRWAASRPDLVVALPILLVIVLVQAVNIGNFPTVSDDEGTYLAQAWAVQHEGALAHYSYWYDHPPLGWLQIAALSWIPALFDHGMNVVMQARVIMVPVTAVAASLVYVVARRIDLPRWAAALAMVVFGLSPLSVTMQREIYLDNFAVPWMLAAFAFALSRRRHLWHHIAAGVCAGVSVLSKETMIITLPALALALWRGSHRSTRIFSLVGFAMSFVLLSFQYLLYATLKGELLPGPDHNSLIGALQFQLGRGGNSGWILQSGSVTNMTLHWWVVRDPVILVVGVGCTLLALLVKRLREVAVASLLLVIVACRPGGYLPAMYVLQALPFFALCTAGVADAIARQFLTGRVSAWLPQSRNVLAFCAVIVAGLVAPHWETGDETADTAYSNTEYSQASAWIKANVADKPHVRIVSDDAMWPDLVAQGFRPGLGAIWFYKVDLDPAVTRTLPHGWKDIDYVVSSSIIREDPNGLPTVRAAMEHSVVVARFGTGTQEIDILRVDKTGRTDNPQAGGGQ